MTYFCYIQIKQGDTIMGTMSFENVLSSNEMSLIKRGDWDLTEDG